MGVLFGAQGTFGVIDRWDVDGFGRVSDLVLTVSVQGGERVVGSWIYEYGVDGLWL